MLRGAPYGRLARYADLCYPKRYEDPPYEFLFEFTRTFSFYAGRCRLKEKFSSQVLCKVLMKCYRE